MNLKEIVFRDEAIPIDQDECIYIIRKYIKARKNVDVKPKINRKGGQFTAMSELALMIEMTNHAIGWFRENLER